MPKRILVAVDESRALEPVMRQAVELAREGHARLKVVHVIDSPCDRVDVMFGHVPGDLDDLSRAWRRAGQTVLDRALALADPAGLEPEVTLVETAGRRVSAAIAEEARRWGADLIILGTHGRHGLSLVLLGSVAEGVARTAPMSVLLVRGTVPSARRQPNR